MSDRERWIVYPLLFLSLGASLRSKVAPIDQFEAHTIRCEQLEVADQKGAKRILLATAVQAPDGKVAPQPTGVVLVYGRDSKPLVILGGDKDGERGYVETINLKQHQEQPATKMQ